MTEPSRHSVSVAAVIPDDQGRVLVIQRRDNGAWQLPGGVLELHETIEDGLRREVEEETGLKVDPIRLTGVYKNVKLGVVALVFLARPGAGTPHSTEEAAAVDWWTPDRVATDMTEAFAMRILDALRTRDLSPEIRAHDGTRRLG